MANLLQLLTDLEDAIPDMRTALEGAEGMEGEGAEEPLPDEEAPEDEAPAFPFGDEGGEEDLDTPPPFPAKKKKAPPFA